MTPISNTAADCRSQYLSDFGPAYFDHVLAQFDLFKAENDIPPYIQEIVDKHSHSPELLRWKDIYALEEFVLEIQPDDVVKARAPSLEESYQEIMGGRAYAAYLKLRPSLKQQGLLRHTLAILLGTLHWIYSMVPAREQMRSDILKQSGKWLLICFTALLPIILVFGFKGETLLATIPLVALMGSLGGFLSLQRRIEKVPTDRDPLLTMLELQNGRFTVALAPLLGAIFAIVLFLMFLGGLLQGSVFPDEFSFGQWKIGDAIVPAALSNFGKLLLWSFIAGFAEKFVPDTLDSIASKGSQSAKAKLVEGAIERSEQGTQSHGQTKKPAVKKGSGQHKHQDGRGELHRPRGVLHIATKDHGRHNGHSRQRK
jgi:hypothetical protein